MSQYRNNVYEPSGESAFPGSIYPRFLPVGDLGLTVEFGEAIDPELNAAVIDLDLALAAAEIPGIVETMPTYRSLLICYEPTELPYGALVEHVHRLLGQNRGRSRRPGRRWTVPVAYGGQHGPDLDEVAKTLRLRPDEVIGAHAGTDYLVYLVGFNPGAPNLGGLPEQLHIPRRKTPHPQVPAGSVAIGGMQTGITSIAIPTGWHLLGRTPVRPFEPRREEPFLFSPGDRIRFRPIGGSEYDELTAAAAEGATVAELDRSMQAALLAAAPTPFVTLQDTGRVGWQRFGVSGCGAMDVEALAAANTLVGNPPGMAALEFAHAGGEWEVCATSCRVAVTGGRFAVTVDGEPRPSWTTITLTRGALLRIGGAQDAVWGYLAVSGGFDLPPHLGSLSTHCRSGIGGLEGRPIRAGDALPLVSEWVRAEPERTLPPVPAKAGEPLRVVMGPQDDYFAPASLETFLSAEYGVTHQMDRLGYRLSGPALEHAKGYNIISDGLLPGSIQVPGSGAPIVLLRDAQLPGGYPKIATIVSADLGRLVQSRPGSTVWFRSVTVEAAQRVRRGFVQRMNELQSRLIEVSRRGGAWHPA